MTTYTKGGCVGKAMYLTNAEARATINRSRHSGHSYHCQMCGGYHVTTMTKQAYKRLTRNRA